MKRFCNRLIRKILIFERNILGRDFKRIRKPKRMNSTVQKTIDIWSQTLKKSDSILLFDPTTGQAVVAYPGYKTEPSVILFLETLSIRVIDLSMGYDIPLTSDEQRWAMALFEREVVRRKIKLRSIASKRLENSLVNLSEYMK